MNPLSPENLLNAVTPGLEGIATDVSVSIIGILMVLLIVVGLGFLKDAFFEVVESRNAENHSSEKGPSNKLGGIKK